MLPLDFVETTASCTAIGSRTSIAMDVLGIVIFVGLVWFLLSKKTKTRLQRGIALMGLFTLLIYTPVAIDTSYGACGENSLYISVTIGGYEVYKSSSN